MPHPVCPNLLSKFQNSRIEDSKHKMHCAVASVPDQQWGSGEACGRSSSLLRRPGSDESWFRWSAEEEQWKAAGGGKDMFMEDSALLSLSFFACYQYQEGSRRHACLIVGGALASESQGVLVGLSCWSRRRRKLKRIR